MKITKISQRGAYSSSIYLYSAIKSSASKGTILLLPESFLGNSDSTTGCFKSIYS